MAKEKKRQVCFRIEDSIVNEMENIRDKTGVPVSTQIELRLKGFTITSVKKEGTRKEFCSGMKAFTKTKTTQKTLTKQSIECGS